MQSLYSQLNALEYQYSPAQCLTSYGLPEQSETIAEQLNDYRTRALLTIRTAEIFRHSGDTCLQKQAVRMKACAHDLRVYGHGGTVRIAPERSCGCRFCSTCHGRADRTARPYLHGLPALIRDHPNHDFHHLTVTLKHRGKTEAATPVGRLSAEITRLKDGLNNFVQKLGTVAYLRKTEVTADNNGMTNPHVHALLCVPMGTLEDRSLPHLWKDALKLRYLPDVHFRTYQGAVDADHIIRTAGYILKPAVKVTNGLIRDPSLFVQMAQQLDGVRAVSASKLFRLYRAVNERPALNERANISYIWSNGDYRAVDARTGIRIPAQSLVNMPAATAWVN